MKNLEPSLNCYAMQTNKNNSATDSTISNISKTVRRKSNGCYESFTENNSPSQKFDELTRAEEGKSQDKNENTSICPICIAGFEVGEEVAWSELGHCSHIFHYECIIPWCVIGHVECPVCRERFWQNESAFCKYCRTPLVHFFGSFVRKVVCLKEKDSVQYVIRRSIYCLIHGLISPRDDDQEC